ncbi:UbiA family prenyltransferase [Kibdelosporangium aridum]|uniref:Geranylgeranylglycerol-phosphate geranylgeranyltransferase n=1 Tax=Kibdelosporangium aridum TaxID=2030 RepID=A0A1Y5Y9P7_KIBAR|nr:UbiA family prenyltransferase [Kibdelosporangium aridum]SMD26521.1 geranylgeranylglycerol-phosphate geranylgeranyltransferase [Kibdelosporangium aridum]
MHSAAPIRVKVLAHIEACRPDTIFYAGTVGLSGAILTKPGAAPGLLILAWLVPTLAWIASLYGGDYFDRELDALTKPHRPVPSGRIKAVTARNMMVFLIALSGLLAVLVNPLTALLAIPAAVFGIAYASWLKGRGLWGNISRGLPTAMTVLYGSMTVQTLPDPALVPLALMFWIHDSGSNLLGALCDRDSDRQGGYFTYPVLYGDEATARGLIQFYAGWVVLVLAWPVFFSERVDLVAYYGLIACAIVLGWISLRSVIRAPRPIARAVGLRAHEIVVIERIILGTFLIAAAGRIELAVVIGIPSLALTMLARRLMRRRYEPRS